MQWKEVSGLLILLHNSNKNYEAFIQIILIITIIIFRHSVHVLIFLYIHNFLSFLYFILLVAG